MYYEMTRVYRDIIDEVCKGLENDPDELYFDSALILDIKNTWTQKLKIYIEKAVSEEETRKYYGHVPLEKKMPVLENSSDEQELEAQYHNNMICLYERVNKSKNKWRCTLKHGFINIGNKDYAFNNATGELEW